MGFLGFTVINPATRLVVLVFQNTVHVGLYDFALKVSIKKSRVLGFTLKSVTGRTPIQFGVNNARMRRLLFSHQRTQMVFCLSTRAGPEVISSTALDGEIVPLWTKCKTAAKAVSNPITPKGARSNPWAFPLHCAARGPWRLRLPCHLPAP